METTTSVDEIARGIGIPGTAPARGWLEYLVGRRMKRAVAKARAKREAGVFEGAMPDAHARGAIRRACIKAAISGTLSGAATTGAVVATAETDGLAGAVVLPLAAAAVGVEMAARTVFHIDLACELAEVFDVEVDSPDVARLLSVALGSAGAGERDDLGQSSIEDATVDRDSLLEQAAHALVGESVLRNLLPFLGVVSSAVTNVIVTRRIGRRLRHAFRYEHEMSAALRAAATTCASCLDLLVEGLWFVFTADGRLTAEETICLAERLDELDASTKRRVMEHFVADEGDWLRRLEEVPVAAREKFLGVLEVAAALDKELSLPEDKLLRRAADVLGQTFDPGRVSLLIDELERTGVLS
jgi:hypothetical protein